MTGTLFNLKEFTSLPSLPKVIDPYWDDIILDVSGSVDSSGQASLFYDDSEEPPDPDDYPDQLIYELAWSDWLKMHPDFKPEMTFPEQEEEEFIEDVVLEELPIEFEVGGIYWHEGRQLKAKIIKIYKSVGKADVYWAGDIFKEKIYLSELSPLPEQSLVSETAKQEVTNLPEQVILEKSHNQWLERYYVTRAGKKYWYDRYCYYQRKIKHIHIPGKPDLKEKVEIAIAQNKPPAEIEKLIKSA